MINGMMINVGDSGTWQINDQKTIRRRSFDAMKKGLGKIIANCVNYVLF